MSESLSLRDSAPVPRDRPKRGAPARFGVRADHAIRIRLTQEQREAVARVAAENDTNITDLIREAVLSFVGDYDDSEADPIPGFRGPESKAAS